jgi:hypothetical protein
LKVESRNGGAAFHIVAVGEFFFEDVPGRLVSEFTQGLPGIELLGECGLQKGPLLTLFSLRAHHPNRPLLRAFQSFYR